MKKLTKGQVEGIRLIADLFVIEDLLKNFFSKYKDFSPHTDDLRKHLQKEVPMPFKAQEELHRQIKLVRREWLERLKNDSKAGAA